MIEIVPYSPHHQDGVVILPIQSDEFGIPVTLADQPDLLDIPGFYQRGVGKKVSKRYISERRRAFSLLIVSMKRTDLSRSRSLRYMPPSPLWRSTPNSMCVNFEHPTKLCMQRMKNAHLKAGVI